MPPPPMSSLSDEELRALEGSTRGAIENRLLILKNVQMLMDAVQAQMQLYNMVSPPHSASQIPVFVPDINTTQHTPTPTASSSAVPEPSEAPGPSNSKEVSVEVDGEMRTYACQEDLDEEIEQRRDDLLKTFNLIDEDAVEERRLEREVCRAKRLEALQGETVQSEVSSEEAASEAEALDPLLETPEGSTSELRKRNIEQRED